MKTIQPINVGATITSTISLNEDLTSAEMGKLWATYMGNSMTKCILSYFLNHVDDQEIKNVVENALTMCEEFVQTIKEIFTKANFPVPIGFTEADVNLGAPRLFHDEFYLHYLIYAGKVGISLYGIALPLMSRLDIRAFYTHVLDSTTKLQNQVIDQLTAKGLMDKPPYIPAPNKVDFVKKQNYLNGFFGKVRPLHALEITHLYDNILNNETSKTILIGFCQVAKLQQVREYFVKGKEIAYKHIETFSQFLHEEDLPSPPLLDHMVTDSTFPPFSDKLMLFHKLDMFTMRIRSYGNSMAVNGRHDLEAKYAQLLLDVANYAEDGANIMIDLEWMEQPPGAIDRDSLTLN
ncbi:DUF3231 family protein [Paenibacillus anseongense]|uniref:DUF3231 family protein n=1 Tax=Paenibacillus anseongense TaxID=2682845 RepID=UPI002DB684EF|nr:DUF3231 family protein [Paenibacillus anseongense]MEC0269428.1 DUF3231 family protein [Paenibacillus anseongense]